MKFVSLFVVVFLLAANAPTEAEEKTSISQVWEEDSTFTFDAGAGVTSIAVHPEGTVVAVSTERTEGNELVKGAARLILIVGQSVKQGTLPTDQMTAIENLVFNPQGTFVFGYDREGGQVLAWSAADGTCAGTVASKVQGPEFAINPLSTGPRPNLPGVGSGSSSLSAQSALAMEENSEQRWGVQVRNADGGVVVQNVPLGGSIVDLDFAPHDASNYVAAACWQPRDRAKDLFFVVAVGPKSRSGQWGVLRKTPMSARPHDVEVSSKDPALVAVGSDSPDVHVLNVKDGTFVSLKGHTGPARHVEFLPDGTLASGSDDGTVRLWDIAKKQCLAVLECGAAVWDIASGPYGHTLYVAGGSQIKRFKLGTAETVSAGVVLPKVAGP